MPAPRDEGHAPGLDRRTPAALARDAVRRRIDRRARQPRALQTRSRSRRRHRRQAVRRRTRDGVGTADPRLLRRVGGTWRRNRRPGGRRLARRTGCAARQSDVPAPTRLAERRARSEGYYFGFANEGLWPLCHRAHVQPVFRSGDFYDVRGGECPIRRGRLRRGGQRLAAGPGAGLSLRARAAVHSRCPPAEHDRRVLAYSVAAFARLRDLPVGTPAAGRAPRQQHRRIPDGARLPQLCRHRRACARSARRPGAERHHLQRPPDDGARVSGVDRVAEPLGRRGAGHRDVPRDGPPPAPPAAGRPAGCRRRSAGLHERASTRSSWRSSGCSNDARSSGGVSCSSRSRNRAERGCRPIAISGRGWREQPIASTGDLARRVTARSFCSRPITSRRRCTGSSGRPISATSAAFTTG